MARKLEKDTDVQQTLPTDTLSIYAQDFVQVLAPDVTFVEDMGSLKKRGAGTLVSLLLPD